MLAKLLRTVAVAVCLTAPAAHANAALSEVFGEGLTGCGMIGTAETLSTAQFQWVLGFISGLNSAAAINNAQTLAMTGSTFPPQYAGMVNSWIVRYCAIHGETVLQIATESFYAEMLKEHM